MPDKLRVGVIGAGPAQAQAITVMKEYNLEARKVMAKQLAGIPQPDGAWDDVITSLDGDDIILGVYSYVKIVGVVSQIKSKAGVVGTVPGSIAWEVKNPGIDARSDRHALEATVLGGVERAI